MPKSAKPSLIDSMAASSLRRDVSACSRAAAASRYDRSRSANVCSRSWVRARTWASSTIAVWNSETQNHGLEGALDHELIRQAGPALDGGAPLRIELPIKNGH